jgi:Spy/CpxP family protein refolding chaperone
MRGVALSFGIVALALMLTSQVGLAQERSACVTVTQEKTCQQVGMMCPMCGSMHGEMMGAGKRCGGGCEMIQKFGGPGLFVEHTEALGLTDRQMSELESIWQTQKKNAIRKRAEIQIAEMELGEILSAETTDFNKARAKLSQIGSLKQDLRLDCLSSIEKAQKVLTADQLSKFKTLKKKACMEMMGPEMKGMGMMKKCGQD